MAKPELTRALLSQTLKTLCQNKDIDKISVSDIVGHAGLNRQTFYYHFSDKQDLICWTFDHEISKLTDQHGNQTRIDDLVEYMYSEKRFYVSALSSSAQNSLGDQIYEIVNRFFASEIDLQTKSRKLSGQKHALCCRFFSHALVGNITAWAKAGMRESPDTFLAEFLPFLLQQLQMTINYYGT